MPSLPKITRAQIRAARPPKPTIDAWQPIGVFVEPERTESGDVLPALTVLLTGKECPFTCLFCDLWQHTTDSPTPRGAIPAQIFCRAYRPSQCASADQTLQCWQLLRFGGHS